MICLFWLNMRWSRKWEDDGWHDRKWQYTGWHGWWPDRATRKWRLIADWLLDVLRPYIFALYRLTRGRQKPGTGETPLFFSIHPKGSFRCQGHRQPHTPLGLIFLPVQFTGILPQRGSNPRPSDHEPGALPCCHRRGMLPLKVNSCNISHR